MIRVSRFRAGLAVVAAVVCAHSAAFAQGLGLKRYLDHALFADRATLYCGLGRDLVILDAKDLENPVVLARLSPGSNISTIRLCRGYIVVGTMGHGIYVYDTANPSNIRLVSNFSTFPDIYGMDVQDDLIAVALGVRGFALVNTLDMKNLRVATVVDTPGEACDVRIWGDRALVADGMGGLLVAERGAGGNWAIRQTLHTRDASVRLAVANGPVVLLSDRTSLRLFELAGNPPVLRETGTYRSQRLSAAFVDILPQGPLAYVAANLGGLEVVDCSRPDSPQKVGAYVPSPEAVALATHGDRAFLLLKNREIRVLDISRPARPFELVTIGLDRLLLLQIVRP